MFNLDRRNEYVSHTGKSYTYKEFYLDNGSNITVSRKGVVALTGPLGSLSKGAASVNLGDNARVVLTKNKRFAVEVETKVTIENNKQVIYGQGFYLDNYKRVKELVENYKLKNLENAWEKFVIKMGEFGGKVEVMTVELLEWAVSTLNNGLSLALIPAGLILLGAGAVLFTGTAISYVFGLFLLPNQNMCPTSDCML